MKRSYTGPEMITTWADGMKEWKSAAWERIITNWATQVLMRRKEYRYGPKS
jgi:hypothetical protein